jgi:hypothetical protein
MRELRRFSVIVLALWVSGGVVGCSRAEPAGFWTRFPVGQRSQNLGRQGGRGGWRALHGIPREGESFSAQRIKTYAAENDWKFLSEQKVSAESLKTWVASPDKKIFPLGTDGFAPGKNDSAYDRFPRWITANATVLIFDSGWITAIGGVEKPAVGCVLLAEDGKSFSVYHLWGE